MKKLLFILLVLFLSFSFSFASAKDAKILWDANTESDVIGYKIYYKFGTSGPPYDGTGLAIGNSPIDVGNVLESGVFSLPEDGTIFRFVVTAYDTEGLESEGCGETIVKTDEWYIRPGCTSRRIVPLE